MSIFAASEPHCTSTTDSTVLRITSQEKDLGEFKVRRVLPASERQMVGPFIFFDHIGPAEFPPGKGIQVRPHPHIGIATITYLFEGEIIHRDSLGYVQAIQEGAVNLMTAGRGIVHSERAGDDFHTHSRLHGIQSWIALPTDQEEIEPMFMHYPAGTLPVFNIEGVTVRIIIGEVYGQSSPVRVYSTALYLECRLPKGSTLLLPESYQELAVYVVTGEVRIDQNYYPAGVMAIVNPVKTVRLDALEDTLVMIIGGDALGKRHLWWNFVSSSKNRLEQAKVDWKEDRFDKVPGETEFIPLPD